MRADQWTRMLAIAALAVSLVAIVVAGYALRLQRERQLEMEALGELIRRSSESGRPLMDMGPPGGGRPELDLGD